MRPPEAAPRLADVIDLASRRRPVEVDVTIAAASALLATGRDEFQGALQRLEEFAARRKREAEERAAD